MANENTLKALCATANRLGVNSTEFWRRARLTPAWQESAEEAAREVLADLRAGGVVCSKCGGTGQFVFLSGPRKGTAAVCYRCRGKGFENPSDLKRNFGHRVHNPGRHEVRS